MQIDEAIELIAGAVGVVMMMTLAFLAPFYVL